MTKKHFIALADAIKTYNRNPLFPKFTDNQIAALGSFCREQNPQFNRERWLGHIAGENGQNGAKVNR
jgi:hypothetical protein